MRAGSFTADRVRELIQEQAKALQESADLPGLGDARRLFTEVALGEPLADFLTIPGYELLD